MNASIAIQVLPKVLEREETLMELVKECQKVCIQAGSPSVLSYVKISYQPGGVWSIQDKTGKYQKEV